MTFGQIYHRACPKGKSGNRIPLHPVFYFAPFSGTVSACPSAVSMPEKSYGTLNDYF